MREIGPSRYITPGNIQRLREQCQRLRLDFERAWREMDRSRLMEGLYRGPRFLMDKEDPRTIRLGIGGSTWGTGKLQELPVPQVIPGLSAGSLHRRRTLAPT